MTVTWLSDVSNSARTVDLSFPLLAGAPLAVGDVIVLPVFSEDNAAGSRTGAATVTGTGTLTLANSSSGAPGNYGWSQVHYGTVTVAGSITVTIAKPTGGAKMYGGVVGHFPAADGYSLAPSPVLSTTFAPSGFPTTSITLSANSSAVWVSSDWNATNPSTVAYAPGNTQTVAPPFNSSLASAYFAMKAGASAGAQTIGLTAPTGQKWALVGVEILKSGAPAPNFFPFL